MVEVLPGAAMLERQTCVACGATTRQVEVVREPYGGPATTEHLREYGRHMPRILEVTDGFDYCLVRCGGCGLIYQRWVLNDALTRELYSTWIDAEEAAAHDAAKGMAVTYAMQVIEVIHHFGRAPDELSVLDYGSGSGEWCRIAAALGAETYGTDLAATRSQVASRGGVTTLPPSEVGVDRFDFINLEQVVEHLSDPIEVLAPLVEALRSGGVIRLSVPNHLDLERRLQVWDWTAPKGSPDSLNAVAPLQHLNAFTHGNLVTLGSRLALEPIYRPLQQLRFAPLAGDLLPALRRAAATFYRAARRQDTAIWFRRRGLSEDRPHTAPPRAITARRSDRPMSAQPRV